MVIIDVRDAGVLGDLPGDLVDIPGCRDADG
jgi:hypothetical protein